MNSSRILKEARAYSSPYLVTSGAGFKLDAYDPADTRGLDERHKDEAKKALRRGIEVLSELQEKLYAQDRWSVLAIFQAMDAAGKDGTIKHVMSGVNPQGCEVHAFKQPTTLELDHDYLWRCARVLPERGRIGIFNRSYYEEVMVVRVHPELLRHQKVPPELVHKDVWKQRFEDIRNFERYLARNGVLILKFFLNVSKQEQKKRFLARLEEPEKHWKFSARDVYERRFWRQYRAAYDEAIRETATKHAPWFVVPADHKWFTHIVVAAALIHGLSSLDLAYPRLDRSQMAELKAAKRLLLGE